MKRKLGLAATCRVLAMTISGSAIGVNSVVVAEEATGPSLETIVVTTQKHSENIQDVPIAISALSSTALSNNKVDTTQYLPNLVPSLVYNSVGGYAMPFTERPRDEAISDFIHRGRVWLFSVFAGED